jgi:hypothetical protein
MNISTTSIYEPQADRLGMLHRAIGIALLAVLMVFLSVYVSQVEPKTAMFIAVFCVLIGGKRLLSSTMWPILALVGYGAMLNIFFPGPKPDFGTLLAHPLFLLDCVLLCALVLGGQSVGRQYALMLGILIISVIGAVGDVRGNDMTALLPFELPDDAVVNVIILQQGDVVRIRGFFTEAGVLCAVSIGVATMLALGAIVLINSRACLKVAWIGLIGALTIGGTILCIAVTKSGFVMIGGCCVGFILVLLCSRNPRCRFLAVTIFATLIIGGGLFMLVGPPTLTSYLRGEFMAAANPMDMTPDVAGSHTGTVTRYKCWALAFASIRSYPFGVGAYGLGSVIQNGGGPGPSREMRYFFSRDNFGLKNALANLIAQNGIVGLGLLGYWIQVAFIRPVRHYLADGSTGNTLIAGLYGASALSCLVFLFSCELYPSFAFMLVMKFHADAIAQACTREPRRDVESIELIG